MGQERWRESEDEAIDHLDLVNLFHYSDLVHDLID